MNQAIWTFVLFWSMPLTTRADVTVTCILTSDCVLPCTSPYHDIIHWHKGTNTNSAHTFYDKADHLEFQAAEFKGRTSLFTDQISQGNASLLLRMIRFEDEGRYKCYTATSSDNKEQFVLLKVKDVTVTCFFARDCVLPCKSIYHEVIQWYKTGKENAVHIFNNNKDHLDYQDAEFRGRTSLFTDQISQGNVSLLLRKVKVEDEGIYTCSTSSSSEDLEIIVRMVVKAPIKRVDIKSTYKEITCTASEVYPKPTITWYENNNLNKNFTTETQKDEQGLFTLKSIFSHKQNEKGNTNRNMFIKPNNMYTCSIGFEDKSQTYTARLRQEKVEIYSGQDAKIHCPVSRGDAGDYNITLRFGESFTVLKSQLTNFTMQWAGINVNLTYDGNVTLHKLDMDKHTGNYTCELFTAQSTTEVVRTSVQIISDIHNEGIAEVLGATVIVMAFMSLIIYYLCELKKRNEENSRKKIISEEGDQELNLLSGENHGSDTYSLAVTP